MIKLFSDWLNEGVDFKDNFTPLYHITRLYNLNKILSSDELKIGNPARGPRGICVTRSKFFEHDGNLEDCRLILNYEELKRSGYRSYPLDEWSLARKVSGVYPTKRKDWINKDALSMHLGKSNFDKLKSGQRPISHNISSLKKGKSGGLEVEYEERILKDIKNLGRFIYGINLLRNINDQEYSSIKEYLNKYPHIKIFSGKFFLKESELEDFLK